MARIRTIKPEFWTSPGIVSLDPFARLLFIGSWNFADDWGLLIDDPERLRLQILPGDQVDAHALVDQLVASGHFVRVVAPNGDRLLSIPTWFRHQKIDSRTKGKWGNPAEWTASPPDPTESRPVPPDPADGIGIGIGNGSGSTSSSSADVFNTRPVDNPDDDEFSATVAQVVDAVVKRRIASKVDLKNRGRYAARVRRNLTTEDGGRWWAELERIVREYRGCPVDMLAAAAEGEFSPHMNTYRQEQVA